MACRPTARKLRISFNFRDIFAVRGKKVNGEHLLCATIRLVKFDTELQRHRSIDPEMVAGFARRALPGVEPSTSGLRVRLVTFEPSSVTACRVRNARADGVITRRDDVIDTPA